MFKSDKILVLNSYRKHKANTVTMLLINHLYIPMAKKYTDYNLTIFWTKLFAEKV